jgi:hypothetical protein
MPGRFAACHCSPGRVLAVCLATLLFAPVVRAQVDDVLPNGGMDALNADLKKYRELASDLIHGTRVADPKDQMHVEALDFQAKYVTYPFTWVIKQQTPGEISKVYGGGIENDVRNLLKSGKTVGTTVSIYAPKVTEHALEVLKTRKLIARINAARVLAKLAELGPPDLSDALVATLQDPDQNDAVKFYIIRGLRVLSEMQPPVMNEDRQKKAAEALAAYIDRKMTIADTTTREEVEGFRYIRREAIRALAQFHNPTVAANGQGPFTLLRVVAKDGLMPPPRVDERVEAAIGLAHIKASLDKYYQPDYAIAQMGLFLDDFNLEYTADKSARDINRGPVVFPWKVMASRMYEAIEQMRNDAGDSPYIVKVANESLKLLEKLEKDIPSDAADIVRMAAAPPAKQLFKNIDETVVKAANRREMKSVVPPNSRQFDPRQADMPGGPAGGPRPPPDGGAPNPFAPKSGAQPAPPIKPGPPPPAGMPDTKPGNAQPAPPPVKGDANKPPTPPAKQP